MTQNVYVPQRHVIDNLGGCARDIYDFALHGGAIGTIQLPLVIPDNAIITECIVDVLTDPASGGAATIALGLNTTTDLLAATAIASVTGIVVAKAQAAAFKLTAERNLQITIATAALTAGKLGVHLKWCGAYDDVTAR